LTIITSNCVADTRKGQSASFKAAKRNVFDQMLGEHVAPAAKTEGEKITINGEARIRSWLKSFAV
jgi:hypothetical protein